MIIRKLFKAESAHIVRNCYSKRCSESIHGHSGIIEIFFESNKLDNAYMVLDFGVLDHIKKFVDSMDHTYLLWSKEPEEFKKFIKKNCSRWIELPFSPSAEALSIFIRDFAQQILNNMPLKNKEGNVKIKGVRYHETTTGWAECDENDKIDYDLREVTFSPEIKTEFGDILLSVLKGEENYQLFVKTPASQIKL